MRTHAGLGVGGGTGMNRGGWRVVWLCVEREEGRRPTRSRVAVCFPFQPACQGAAASCVAGFGGSRQLTYNSPHHPDSTVSSNLPH